MTSLLHKFTHTQKEVAEEFSNEIDNTKTERQKEAVVLSWWFALEKTLSPTDMFHGVLTFRNEVISPPNQKINYFLMLRHFVTRIFWN